MKCSCCQQEKSESEFYKDKRTSTGLYSNCKSCHKAVNSKSLAATPRDNSSRTEACACGSRKWKKSKACRQCQRLRTPKPDSHGYLNVSHKGRRVGQHRVVMEMFLGRALETWETVHHKNGVRTDNRLENLELWASRQPKGQRVDELVEWANEIISMYGSFIQPSGAGR